MASNILFPPIVDNYTDVFQIKSSVAYNECCKVYFSLANFNSITDFAAIHAVVYDKKSNKSVVNLADDEFPIPYVEEHYRRTGIILNLIPKRVLTESNLFYVEIFNTDLNSDNAITHIEPSNKKVDHNQNEILYKGQIPGQIYKIQLRLSKYIYDPSEHGYDQEAQLNENANNFSQQSRTCVVKPIGKTQIEIPYLDYNSEEPKDLYERKTVYTSTLDLQGKFYEESKKEKLYSFNVQIYSGTDINTGQLLEDSGEQFTNNQADSDEFKYLCKTELDDLEYYTIKIKVTTKNQFVYETQVTIMASLAYVDMADVEIYTVDDLEFIPKKEDDPDGIYNTVRESLSNTSIHEEQEEGRVGLKLFSNETNLFYGSFYIRRSSSKDDFKYWYDIKLVNLKDMPLNNYPMFYDYTIESGVWYKYGIQQVDKDGYRGILHRKGNPVLREFEYSYLLGPNNQQLKLMFNNTMQNYKIQVLDSKTETIGAKYPRVTRNGAVQYKIFPIEGLISAWMDENKTFCSKEDIYKYEDVITDWTNYDLDKISDLSGFNSDLPIPQQQYDYTYERDFRDVVMDFLHDGKPKLFKSPTEGNVIVRLMDINCTPVQSLDRLLYSFTSNGNQIADSTIENYIKYHFIDIDNFDNLSTKKTLLGQLHMEFDTGANGDQRNATNIFKVIYDKHNRENNDFGGYSRKLLGIHHVRITFEDKPIRVKNLVNQIVIGYTLHVHHYNSTIDGDGQGTYITVTNPLGMYTFDERLTFTYNDLLKDTLTILPDEPYEHEDPNNPGTTIVSSTVTKIKATVDYLYDIEESLYTGKTVVSKKVDTYLGQFYEACKPDESIYNKIFKKYYTEWSDTFTRLNTLSSVEIEAQPGMVIWIKDQADPYGYGETHVINESGILDLSRIANITEVKVKGFYDPNTGTVDTIGGPERDQNVMVNYHCTIVKGQYDVEE